jgi:hypothetical protein
MATLVDKAARRWEMHHPLAMGALSFVVVLWRGAEAYAFANHHSWKIDQLYTCVFTLSTVFTAFLFTFYTFVITAERGFLGKARNSIYFKRTVSYTLVAIAVGAALCLATVPLLVVQPSPYAGDVWLVYIAFWAALTIWAGASFVRAAYLFAIFAGRQG